MPGTPLAPVVPGAEEWAGVSHWERAEPLGPLCSSPPQHWPWRPVHVGSEQHPERSPALTLGRNLSWQVSSEPAALLGAKSPWPTQERAALCSSAAPALGAGSRLCAGMVMGCPCCAVPWMALAEGPGAPSSGPGWSGELSHGSAHGRTVLIPMLPETHAGTCPSHRVLSHGQSSGQWGRSIPLSLFSLCEHTALPQPLCNAVSRKAAKAGRLPSFCLLPSRCGWPCQADGSAPGRDERRRQEQLAPSIPGQERGC